MTTETPEIVVEIGEVFVSVRGSEDDTLEDVEEVFDRKVDEAIDAYLHEEGESHGNTSFR